MPVAIILSVLLVAGLGLAATLGVAAWVSARAGSRTA